MTCDPDLLGRFLRTLKGEGRGFVMLRVWTAAMPFVEPETGVLTCKPARLSALALTSHTEVRVALERLQALGAVQVLDDGSYCLHPALCWAGSTEARERALALRDAPELQLA